MDEHNIFDFEQRIMKCWSITEDLDLLCEEVCEGNRSQDDIANVLLGLKTLNEMRFNKLWSDFEWFCREYHRLKKAANYNDESDGC